MSQVITLRKALLERLKKAETELRELHEKELKKAVDPLLAPQPAHNPSIPNPVAPDLNAAPQSPVGAANEVPVGQLGPEGQAGMETGGGLCPLCGQEDVPGKCVCLQGAQAPAQAAPAPNPSPAGAQPLALSEKLTKTAPPGREAQVKALKPKVGTDSAFKIAWSSYDKKSKKTEVKKNAGAGYGGPGVMPSKAGGIVGTGGMMRSEAAAKAEDLCKQCGKLHKAGSCMEKADFTDPSGVKKETGVVGKRPPNKGGTPELSPAGSGNIEMDKAESDKIVHFKGDSFRRTWCGNKSAKNTSSNGSEVTCKKCKKDIRPGDTAKSDSKLDEPKARVHNAALDAQTKAREIAGKKPIKPSESSRAGRMSDAADAIGAKKAEPPMAKPPSGKNPATMVPAAKPMAPKPMAAPKAQQPKVPGMNTAGAMKGSKMGLAMKSEGMASCKQCGKPFSSPVQQMNAMTHGVCKVCTKDPDKAHIAKAEVANQNTDLQMSEFGSCPMCKKPEHPGDCKS